MTGASPDLLPERAVQRHDPIHQEQRQGQKQEEKLQLCQVHGRKNLQLESSQQLYVGLFLGGNIVWPHAVNQRVTWMWTICIGLVSRFLVTVSQTLQV